MTIRTVSLSKADRRASPIYEQMLLRKLLHAFYWVDDGLQCYMMREKGFSLPRAQSMLMACIVDGIQQQSEIAQHLRVSKQAVQQSLKALIAKDLVRVEPDPSSGRRKQIVLTPKGMEMRNAAEQSVQALNRELERRIGAKRLEALHDALDADWGDPVS